MAHDHHHLRLQLGIAGEAGIDLRRGFVEDFASRDLIAAGLAGIGDLEHVGHEVGNSIGAIALSCNATELHGFNDGKGSEQYDEAGRHADRDRCRRTYLPMR